jgi:GntR family transcriptional repressor for pyruvate dehydrogenase complex
LKLEHTGFVVTRQGATGGTYVTELTFDNLVDAFVDLFLMGRISVPELLKVRLLVEPEIARLAALNFMPASAQRLKDAIQAEEITKTSLSKDALYSFRIFHYILAEMSGNRFLEALMRSLIGLTTKVVDVVSADPLSIHQVGMHHPILEAVLAGDGEAAAEAMKKHTIEFGENLIGAEESYRKKLSSGEKRTLFERNG